MCAELPQAPDVRRYSAHHNGEHHDRVVVAHPCEYSLSNEIALAPSSGLAASSTSFNVPAFCRCSHSAPKSTPRRPSSDAVVACAA
jgi:hypothetical protein